MEKQGHDRHVARPATRRFQTTRWSLLLAARGEGRVEAEEALASLCDVYWYPLYAFVRRKGHDAHAAEDVVQGLFTLLLERGDLASVAREKGRFRSFLMAACSHYLANRADHDRAKKRGGGRLPLSIDRVQAEGRYGGEPAHRLTAERLFERQWALTLLGQVLDRLETEMASAGKSRHFEVLRPALLGSGDRLSYAELGEGLGLSEEAARAASARLRRRYRALLREEVGRTVEDPAEVDEEIHALFAALGS